MSEGDLAEQHCALQHRAPWKQSVLKAEAVQRCLGGLRWHRAALTAGPRWVCASCCRAALHGDRRRSFLSPNLLFLLARFHSKPGCLCFFMPSPQEQSVVADLPCQLIKKSIRVAAGRKLLSCRGAGVPAACLEGRMVPQHSRARSAEPAPPKQVAAGGCWKWGWRCTASSWQRAIHCLRHLNSLGCQLSDGPGTYSRARGSAVRWGCSEWQKWVPSQAWAVG